MERKHGIQLKQRIKSEENKEEELERNLEDLEEGSFRWNLQPYGFSVFESLRGNGSVVPPSGCD